MKNIAITQRLIENRSYHEVRDALDIRWAKLFAVLNYVPIIFPTFYDFRKYFKLFTIDGIVLSGGNDLGSLSSEYLSKKRDVFEKKIITFAIKNDIPVFGVCRGMQIIADYFGASFKKMDGHIGVRHKLTISENSRFKDALKAIKSVNSYHSYGIRNIAKDVIVSAISEDGAIEAIEHKKHRIFGQMWHSERNQPFRKAELNIIKQVFAKRSKSRGGL